MISTQVQNFTLHGESGISVLDSNYLQWLESHKSSEMGKIVAYSWQVNGATININIDRRKENWEVLPDTSGFIRFEKPNNCTLLDAYGKERIRLSIPWQFTKSKKPESENQESFFINTSAPFVNPADGQEGKFGVTARIANDGKYYFELDYHTGQFLWGKSIWD